MQRTERVLFCSLLEGSKGARGDGLETRGVTS
jgi:hypothetical protein